MHLKSDVVVIAKGDTCCAVCAPRGMQREIVCRDTQAVAPVREGWDVYDGGCPDGAANPRPCRRHSDREHWLLVR